MRKIRYDVDQIRSISGEELCDHFGFETKKIGRLQSVLCPFHDDNHFGSAYVRDNGIYCFVCNQHWDAIKLAEDYLNLNFIEALDYLSEAFHIQKESFEIDPSKSPKIFPLTLTDLRNIGLCRENRKQERYPSKIFLERPDDQVVYKEDFYYYSCNKGSSTMTHMKYLWKNYPDLFQEMIKDKCNEAYQNVRRLYWRLGVMYVNSKDDTGDIYLPMIDMCKERMETIKEIHEKAVA